MDYTVWQLLIIIISFGMVLLSIFCVIAPQKLIHGMPHLINSKLAKYSDITIRFFLGISLVLSAETAIFPLIFTLLGYLSLVAVLALMILGTSKVEFIIKYITDILPVWAVRLVCVFSVFLFAFLIHNIG
jgi:hypothetical protein